jgi:hypothetical protein
MDRAPMRPEDDMPDDRTELRPDDRVETGPDDRVDDRPDVRPDVRPDAPDARDTGDPMLNTTASEEMRERSPQESGPADWRGLDEYQHRFEALQAEFIERPKETVEKAESLIEEAVDQMMNSLRDRVRRVHSEMGDGADTERLRLAMRGYRDLFDALGGGRA